MNSNEPIIMCELSSETRSLLSNYTESLRSAAASIGDHGMNEDEFWSSGLFHGAVERIRGTQSATMDVKRSFIADVLTHMKSLKLITSWEFRGSGERHDYEILIGERICIIEAKGCLDGNNTNIFERPANADEFIIWSLCQNPGSDPRHNAWSGIHTRLSAEIIHRRQLVDGLIIWDMLCGTKGRICPKITQKPDRVSKIGNRQVPPPCLYLFPKTIPDPRNNPSPRLHSIKEISFFSQLHKAFKGDKNDIVQVGIEARHLERDIERRTIYSRDNSQFRESRWTKLKRAK